MKRLGFVLLGVGAIVAILGIYGFVKVNEILPSGSFAVLGGTVNELIRSMLDSYTMSQLTTTEKVEIFLVLQRTILLVGGVITAAIGGLLVFFQVRSNRY